MPVKKIPRDIARASRNGRVSNTELANRVGLSPSACLHRVQVPEWRGIIKGYRAALGSSYAIGSYRGQVDQLHQGVSRATSSPECCGLIEKRQAHGKTPPTCTRRFRGRPLRFASMAENLAGTSRAAVQRNLVWMEKRGLIRQITGEGRFPL